MESTRGIVDELKNLGYRLTPQRLMIASAIENSHDHISAEEIYSQVLGKYPNINISTIYRTLELLEQLGLVTETDLGGGRVRYHPADKGRHHHLICQECGTVVDLDEAALSPLKDALLRQYDFTADLRHLGIFGRCIKCRQ
ncbi:MAG: transcriptional repressor [Chloroflexi bacterium]|nr:transcriptional repressor [Chloroflexota bacterium]